MNTRKPTSIRHILKTLDELKTLYPSYNLGKHLSTALDGHDMWGITDNDFLNALQEYKAKFEMDIRSRMDEDDISRIIKDGLRMHTSFDLQDEDFYEE
jgi:hypothetical protein